MSNSLFRPAQKAKIKGRVCLAGPTGAGKTWTGLMWARTLAGPGGRIAVIDTENRSSELYADEHAFDVLTWDPPYDVVRLGETAKAAVGEGYDVVMVDSLSHFWEGEGGVLDYVDNVTSRSPSKNSYMAWKEGTPLLRHLMDTLIWLDAHVIVTLRSKMAYELQEDEQGKKKPVKLGLAPVMRAGVEYEFDVIGDMDLEHTLTVSKSRCHPIADKVAHRGRAGEVAEAFKAWLDTGVELVTGDQAARLRSVVSGIPDKDERSALARGFKDRFGPPDVLPAERFDDALSWLAEQTMPSDDALADVPPPPDLGDVAPAIPDEPEFDVDDEAPHMAAVTGLTPDEPGFDVDAETSGPAGASAGMGSDDVAVDETATGAGASNPHDTEVAPNPAGAPPSDDRTLTDPQMKQLRALYRELGEANAAAQKRITGLILDTEVSSHAALTFGQAQQLIRRLLALADGSWEFVTDDQGNVVGTRATEVQV